MKPLKSIVNQSGKKENITYIGFDLSDAALLRRNMPDNPVFWLRGVPFFSLTFSPWKIIRTALLNRFDGIDVEYPLINDELLNLAHENGLEIHAWTVNDIETCKELAGLHVHGITTDCPDLVINALRNQ
jgi:glycerophosphoryl diester phosphodiesterase